MTMVWTPDANVAAARVFDRFWHDAPYLGCQTHGIGGARLIDAGVAGPGSLTAGIFLARLCMGDRADIRVHAAPPDGPVDAMVWVTTDASTLACLGCQYAGWPLKTDSYFAMASGPMRMLRGREETLLQLGLLQNAVDDTIAVGVLESENLPDESAIHAIAQQCGVSPQRLALAIAPSTSLAGALQVVARSIETAMHKLHALKFDVTSIVSASGQAPLPPPAPRGDTVSGIGRTNDAILYGARVTLWADADDDAIESVVDQVPSTHSREHGQPFATILKRYAYDFYQVDPMLFSPAVVTFHSVRTGKTWRRGRVVDEVLRASFGL